MGIIILSLINPKKSLGQNFLIDNNILTKINDYILADKDDLIVEIGSGTGLLTKILKEKHSRIIGYEIDKDLKPYLDKLIDEKLEIKYIDILKSHIKEDIKGIKFNNLYVVGNLPYYITTPIIKFLIKEELPIYEMILMVQKEVADRFTAKVNTKNYNSLTLFLRYYFDVEKLFDISKKSFKPVPKVDSSILRFKKRNNKINVDSKKYFKLLEDSFKYKRKTLKNNLNNYDFNKIKIILDKYNLKDTVRAEEIEEKIFMEIANII